MKDAEATKGRLLGLAETLYPIGGFQRGTVPHLALPSRTKNNLEYDQEGEIWVYGDQESVRSVKTVRGRRASSGTTYLVELLISRHLRQNRGSTLREIYYISENWDIAKFGEQAESDRLVEDLEILTALLREDFHVRPEEDETTVFGPLTISEKTRRGEDDPLSGGRRRDGLPDPSTSTAWNSRTA